MILGIFRRVRAIAGSIVVLGIAAACASAPETPAPTPAPTVTVTSRAVDVSADRVADITMWVPERRAGVVMFSHGIGSEPARYDPLVRPWAEAGWLVLAATHVDSAAHPDRDSYTPQTAFFARLADTRAVFAMAEEMAPGAPVVSVGHSFGSLMAAIGGGGLRDRGGVPVPAVRAVVMYSSPGKIPGLITERAYARVDVPLLVVTGDEDTVPGLVSDPQDHLYAFETAPEGNAYAVMLPGVGHRFGLTPEGVPSDETATASDLGAAFFRAFALGEEEALAALEEIAAAAGTSLRRR